MARGARRARRPAGRGVRHRLRRHAPPAAPTSRSSPRTAWSSPGGSPGCHAAAREKHGGGGARRRRRRHDPQPHPPRPPGGPRTVPPRGVGALPCCARHHWQLTADVNTGAGGHESSRVGCSEVGSDGFLELAQRVEALLDAAPLLARVRARRSPRGRGSPTVRSPSTGSRRSPSTSARTRRTRRAWSARICAVGDISKRSS